MSQYFLPTLKEVPKEVKMESHRLMLRTGMIKQVSSGIYNWLPMGLKLMRNIESIIRQESEKFGVLEMLMPTIQPKSLWHESGRADSYGPELLSFQDRHGIDIVYGPTNEEVITDIFRKTVTSYRKLPLRLYHIQWKFRDEIRPRFGVMRAREFLMKDAYSFDLTADDAKKSYILFYNLYLRIFKKLDVSVLPVKADNGVIGGDLSHEFHILSKAGESEVVYDSKLQELLQKGVEDFEVLSKLYAVAKEKGDIVSAKENIEGDIQVSKSIEIGHIFYFGKKYTEAMGANILNKEGKNFYPEMGSYGIGITRLVAALIEVNHDEKGIVWPISVAPFKVIILNLQLNDEVVNDFSQKLYQQLINKNIEVLYDNVVESIGKKFANADLIGIPYQVIVSLKNLKQGEVEIIKRDGGEKVKLKKELVLNYLLTKLDIEKCKK